MADIAALGIKIDSSGVVRARRALTDFSKAANDASSSVDKMSASVRRMVAAFSDNGASKMAADVQQAANSARNAQASFGSWGGAATATTQALMGTSKAAVNTSVAFNQLGKAAQQADAHVQLYNSRLQMGARTMQQADAHVIAYRNSMNSARQAINFTARDGLNASRQLADIGVTAAMGMNPFMIALQQGPQLFDILQESAIRSGTSIGTAFKAAGAAIWTAMAPLLPFIAALAAATGILAGTLALLSREANKNTDALKTYTTEMGYTKAQVAQLNAVTVTMGDTAKAVFQVGFQRIAESFGISSKSISDAWNSTLDFLLKATRAYIAGIYAAFAGLNNLIPRLIENMKTGRSESPVEFLTNTFSEQYNAAQTFMDDVVKQAGQNARARQDALAATMTPRVGGAGAGSSAGRRGRTFEDVIRRAQAEINAERAKAEAVGLSAREAATLEQRTKLLNQVERAKIPITDAVRAKVDELASAYSEAKVAAESAAAVQGVVDGLRDQSNAFNDQLAVLGLYGDELIRARHEVEALAKARQSLPEGEDLTSAQSRRIMDSASIAASDEINLNRADRIENLRKTAEDMSYALELERKGLELTGAAAIAYDYAADQLNQARQEGIDLMPEEIQRILNTAEAYGQARYSIDQMSEAMNESREVSKSFFTSWFEDVRNGGDVFKAFADSVIKSLNRITDKLLKDALDGLFGNKGGGLLGLFGGGGGALQRSSLDLIAANPGIFANGGAFHHGQKFAKGGAFTNSIVSTPTLFRFANGGALGEMGEAGPEAIMPLKRGHDGSLGVQMYGGSGQQSVQVEIVDTTGLFVTKVNGQIAQSAPLIIDGSVNASRSDSVQRGRRRLA